MNPMKAIRVHEFGGPDVLTLGEIPPLAVGPGQVLVRVKAIGVNPVETYVRSGSNPAQPLPYTPGSDAVGVIEAVGDGVMGWNIGHRVYTSATATGAYAEAVICRAEDVHALPETLSFEEGAAVNIPYATAYRALVQRARATAGERVLIHGASGGVGIAAVQLARAIGLTIIGTAGTEKGRQLVLDQGAHHCLDHRAPGYLAQLPALTASRGPDIILEMLSNVNLASDCSVIANRGRIIVIGCRGKTEINPRDLMIRDADVRGLILFNATRDELIAIHAALGAGLENRTLRPIVGRTFPLEQAATAHVAVLEPGAFGKIVLLP
jgi:NADPH2:quinone reductase